MGFNLRNLQRLGSSIEVTFPKDEEGFVGRECPDRNCLGYFKVKPGTGLTGPDLACHCPYCGHAGRSDTFLTPAQIEYARSIAMRRVGEALQRDLKGLEFNHRPQPGSFGIGVSVKFTPGTPVPIRYYRERSLETHITCAKCTLDYAIFGLFAFCPDCGGHNSGQMLEKNLEVIAKQLVLAESQTDADLKRQLTEDALENCVSAFDGFARETCRVRAAKSADPIAAAEISFQNLHRADQRLRALFQVELSTWLAAHEWQFTRRGFLRRHLLAHRSGVIDEQYRREAQDAAAILGRRIAITSAEVTELIGHVRQLGSALVGRLPVP